MTLAYNLISAARQVHPELPEIHFDFFVNGAINALAFRSNDRYFIGLTSGALYMLRFVTGRMLSDARLCQYVGDPKAERDDLESVADYAPDAEVMHKVYHEGAFLTPNDPNSANVRPPVAKLCAPVSSWPRANAHSTRSCRLLKCTAATRHRQRIVSGEGNEEERLERQCLEQDADYRSLYALIDTVRVRFEKPTPERNPWRPGADQSFFMFVDLAVSLNIVFRLFGDVLFSPRI